MDTKKIISGHIATIQTSASVAFLAITIYMTVGLFIDRENNLNPLGLLLFPPIASFFGSAFFLLQFIELDPKRGLLIIRNFRSLFRKVTVPLSAIEHMEWRPWHSMPNGVMDLLFVQFKNSKNTKSAELIILSERLGSPFEDGKSSLFSQIEYFVTTTNPKIKLSGLFLNARNGNKT